MGRAPAISQKRYSSVAIVLHWMIALLIIAQLASGFLMIRILEPGQTVFTIYQMHKSIGIMVLALTLARIFWRLIVPPPPLSQDLKAWEKGLAHFAHAGFYFIMLAIPMTGWLMVSSSETGVPTYFFLLQSLPFYHLPVEGIEGVMKRAHLALSILAILLIFMHVGGALKHQFIDKKPSLERMSLAQADKARSPRAGLGIAVLLVLALPVGGVALGIAQNSDESLAAHQTRHADGSAPRQVMDAAASQEAVEWLISYEESDLSFSMTYAGRETTGQFIEWQADVTFSPDAPEEGRIEVLIDVTSVTISDNYLNQQASGADGFNFPQYPNASFVSDNIERVAEGEYIARGTLTLRGVALEVDLPFTFVEEDGFAFAEGLITLNRLDFGIGAGSARTEEWLSHAVEVSFRLTAVRGDE